MVQIKQKNEDEITMELVSERFLVQKLSPKETNAFTQHFSDISDALAAG